MCVYICYTLQYIGIFALIQCQRKLGDLTTLYKEICELEAAQQKVNPSLKSVYKDVADRIQNACVRFGNELSAVKTHFQKKRKPAKAKAKVEPTE